MKMKWIEKKGERSRSDGKSSEGDKSKMSESNKSIQRLTKTYKASRTNIENTVDDMIPAVNPIFKTMSSINLRVSKRKCQRLYH